MDCTLISTKKTFYPKKILKSFHASRLRRPMSTPKSETFHCNKLREAFMNNNLDDTICDTNRSILFNHNKKIECSLLKSISKNECTDITKLQLAENIQFKKIPDKIIYTDEYGFIVKERNESINSSKELLKLNARIEKWKYMLNDYKDFSTKYFKKLKSRTRKGIPDNLRSYAWQKFSNYDKYYIKHLFQSLDEKNMDPILVKVILHDIDRTFPSCLFFKDKYGEGQRKLFHVLSNYSKYNEEVGYVQGMGFLAALFLTYMDEESSFFMLHILLTKYELEGLYLPGFPELNKKFFVLLNLEKEFIPNVYEVLKKNDLMPSTYASEWFMCLFSRNLGFNIVMRIFDCFMLEGFKVIYRFSLAFLKMKENEFIKAGNCLEYIMNTLNSCFKDVNIDHLFKEAFSIHLSKNDIKRYENEYEKVKGDRKNEFMSLII